MIKILFLAANPLDTDLLRIDEEMRAIDAALRQGAYRDQFDIRSHGAVRIGDLQELLLRHQPDIVHFSGHGSDTSEIMLQDEDGDAVFVAPEELSNLFRLLVDNIRCVVLNACYSEHQAAGIAEHIDCVVGMSDAISDDAAREFATSFYRALGYGRSIQTAFELGKSQIDLSNLDEQDIPLLMANQVDPAAVFITATPDLEETEPEQVEGEEPYQGLNFFDVGDAGRFFGREALTTELVSYVRDHRLLAVIGASGSGKSSVVRAGVVPAIRENERWRIAPIITPTAHPLETLATALVPRDARLTTVTNLMDDLRSDARCLHLHLRQMLADDGEHDHLLLVVDQFEELFTLCRDRDEQRAFVDNLLTAAAPDGVTTVILTLRADFYAHCAAFANLRTALETDQRYIGAMTDDELRAAIVKPAEQGGWALEPGLAEMVLHDVADEPGALPLLSHALLETWKRRSGRTLTFAGYHAAGGVKGAIAHTADSVYGQFDADEKAIARNIFLRLTELGEGVQDTRRRVPLQELTSRAETAPMVEDVLQTLQTQRLVTTVREEMPASDGEDKTAADGAESVIFVDVTHEALIREWPALKEWLAEDREGLRTHRKLTEEAQAWEKLDRDPGVLYRGLRLDQSVVWAEEHAGDLNEQEREFLAESQAQVEAARLEEERLAREREEARQRELEQAQELAAAAEAKRQAETERAQEAEARRQAESMRAEEAEARRKAEEERAQEAEARQQVETQRAQEAEQSASRFRRRGRYLAAALFAAVLTTIATGYFFVRASQNAQEAEANAQEAEANAAVAEARLAQFGQAIGGLGIDRILAIAEELETAGDTDGAMNLLQTAIEQNPELVSGIQVDEMEPKRLDLLRRAVSSLGTELAAADDVTAVDELCRATQHLGYCDIAGAKYSYVPADKFRMGSDERDTLAGSDERPQHTVTLDAFWIMSTEVTNELYARCVIAGVCTEPSSTRWNDSEFARHPVTDVNWEQAQTYAEWVGGRLPTEAEWERACRGSEGAIYPWGDEPPSSDLLNFGGNVDGTTDVGSYPVGASGIYDMAGNVSEWTADRYDSDYYAGSPERNPQGPERGNHRTLRGGSWSNFEGFVRCANRNYYVPDFGFVSNGFRVMSPGF